MTAMDQDIISFIISEVPETTTSDMPNWSENDRDPSRAAMILVKLDPVVATMTSDEFLTAVEESSETSIFTCLIEVYPEADGEDAVYRLTGSRVDDPPRYFIDSHTGALTLHGAYYRDNIAVGVYDDDLYDESAHKYIDAYRLFEKETGENQAERIRSANSIMDRLRKDLIEDDVETLRDATDGSLDAYFDTYGER